MIVMKFGGSSVSDRSRMEHVARIVARHGGSVTVVVSAMGGITDALLHAAAVAERGGQELGERISEIAARHHAAAPDGASRAAIEPVLDELRRVLEGMRLLGEHTPRSRALLASIGERLAAPLLAAHVRCAGLAAEAIDARSFVVTDDEFEGAAVLPGATLEAAERVLAPVARRTTPVVTGFIGATAGGVTTTLGRGGSDYSAALVGKLLGAEEIWIWTDVNGVLTADPRLVKEARSLDQISYREAAEMSYFGAKVLHPKTMSPAVEAGIPIRVKNTFEPEHPGTLVTSSSRVLPQGVKTVSSVHDLALVTLEGRGMAGVPGVARRVFEASEAARVNVVMISQASSEQTISMVVPGADAPRLEAELGRRFALEMRTGALDRIALEREVAIASIVGEGMAGTPGTSGKLFGALGAVRVNVLAIAQGASELSISVALKESEVRRAVRAIHSAFGLTRRVNLMVLGCGQVGRTFLRLLGETRRSMEAGLGLELRLVGLATSTRLLLEEGGLDPGEAVAALEGASPRPSDEELLARLHEARCSDLILVDLTAADTADLQRRCLASGLHVVTANKRPLSGPLADYEALLEASRCTGAQLEYETTFGAGLPVLHTLKELVQTGDRIELITGAFSGTLGLLCTRLEEGAPLDVALREATAAGLTEPDPREDLSGRDVMRKALIIARTVGMRLEPGAVALSPLVPDLDGPLEVALSRHGEELSRRVAAEAARGHVLRFVASISEARVEVGLAGVPLASPLGSLRGRDNMLVYRTARYRELPLVIRGPGAGAEVTAAGVLGDVLKVARR
jgi:bifunctional aspartokinase / homoserine dehydrogenase 1